MKQTNTDLKRKGKEKGRFEEKEKGWPCALGGRILLLVWGRGMREKERKEKRMVPSNLD